MTRIPLKATYEPGCYVDGHHGIYATDAIVDFARAHGATITRDCDCDHDLSCHESEFASCEYASEYEDEANTYMEEHCPVPGAHWGRNDSGDWGLWDEEGE